jgi:hypothetical protein
MLLSQQGGRCAGCSVSVSLEAVLGTDNGPGFLGSPSGFMTTPAGGYLVTDSYNPAELKVFAPDGSFSRVVGRKGRGPGEFEFAAHLLPAEGDSLWVVDVGPLRRNLFSATLDFGRSVPFKAPAFSVVAPNPQAFVVNARIYTDSAIGLALHLVEASGGIVRSFGSPGEPAGLQVDGVSLEALHAPGGPLGGRHRPGAGDARRSPVRR